MLKKYEPEALVAISRYRAYFPTLQAEIQRDVYRRMHVLLEEEKRWCDKGNYKHIAQILTSIALYEVLQQHGRTEEEAFGIVSTEMWKQLTPDTYRKLARHSWFLPAMKKILSYTDFIRTKTLCQGGDCCDFDFVRHETDAGDGWERTKSI